MHDIFDRTLREFGRALVGAILWAAAAGGDDATAAAPTAAAAPGPCAVSAAAAERAHGIPAGLLGAIAKAESGRWDEDGGETIAWPWTVTAEGRGRFFPSKADAVAAVEALQARGVRNIDVGCLQVNQLYHADAFPTLEDAFDPAQGADYAARFLRDLYADTGSWTEAAGRYHSSTPELGRRYQAKVLRFWDDRDAASATTAAVPGGIDRRGPRREVARDRTVSIDHVRTDALNQAYRERRAADQPAAATAGPDGMPDRALEQLAIRHRQIHAWRESQVATLDYTHEAAMQRARKELERQLKSAPRGTVDDEAFAERRRKQLSRWRDNGRWSKR